MRLIDADALLEKLIKSPRYFDLKFDIENAPTIEPKTVCEDAISKHDLWRIIEDNAYWVTYNETSKEKGMTLTGINQALNECPPVDPERPKGEWQITINGDYRCTKKQIPEACKNCSNHPSNGGSGICFCTLGGMKITC